MISTLIKFLNFHPRWLNHVLSIAAVAAQTCQPSRCISSIFLFLLMYQCLHHLSSAIIVVPSCFSSYFISSDFLYLLPSSRSISDGLLTKLSTTSEELPTKSFDDLTGLTIKKFFVEILLPFIDFLLVYAGQRETCFY